jgi:hypothetical protein
MARRAGIAVGISTLAVLFCACSPLTAPPPFHLMETTEVLKRNAISVTVAAGGGGAVFDGDGAGGGLRVGLGVADKHEVRLEGTGLYHETGDKQTTEKPWQGKHWTFGWKLSWKYAPARWFALIAGGGGSSAALGTALGADLALLVSYPRGRWRPYLGVRGGVSVPVDNDVGGITEHLVVPAGLAIVLSPTVRLYVEGGYLHAWSKSGDFDQHAGGYGGMGLEFRARQ